MKEMVIDTKPPKFAIVFMQFSLINIRCLLLLQSCLWFIYSEFDCSFGRIKYSLLCYSCYGFGK
jgi:hypothetical protein